MTTLTVIGAIINFSMMVYWAYKLGGDSAGWLMVSIIGSVFSLYNLMRVSE